MRLRFYFSCANTLERYFQTKMKEIGLWDKWCSPTKPELDKESDPEDDDDDEDDQDKVIPKAGYGMKTKAIPTQFLGVDLIKPADGVGLL